MRRALNENPVVQAGLIGVLAMVLVVVFLMRMGGGSSEPAPAASEPAADTATAPTTETPAAVPPSPTEAVPATPATPPAAGGEAVAPRGFAAGPGLPEPVVDAYDDGKIVVLMVVRENGIDDRLLLEIVERLRARSDTALFVVRAKGIARYSRIAQGVQVDRTPALVVLSPKRINDGPVPTATVSYGFRGPGSVEQAVDDAAYDGPSDLPYYPG